MAVDHNSLEGIPGEYDSIEYSEFYRNSDFKKNGGSWKEYKEKVLKIKDRK